MFFFNFFIIGVPGDCYKLDIDPTDEEDEEGDVDEKVEVAPAAQGAKHEHAGHIFDDGSLDRLPNQGKYLNFRDEKNTPFN